MNVDDVVPGVNSQKLNSPIKLQRLNISDVEIIPNEGEMQTDWVYDITVEPTHNFISHGVILHNTISIAKAGIVATLQSKTAIIAAANPKGGRYDEHKFPSENIDLSPPILSRFDLIFIVKDKPEAKLDDRIAEHVLKNHMEGYEETFVEEHEEESAEDKKEQDYIPMDLFKKYIRYAKKVSHPRLTKEIAARIKEYYLKLRGQNNGDHDAPISVVARTLDGIVRMCEAYAKMAIRDVLPEDLDAVIELLDRSMHDVGFDAETGKIDMDRILSGNSNSKRNKIQMILDKISEIRSCQSETKSIL